MIRRDYTKEIGVSARKNTVPWPIALGLLAALALGAGWLISRQSKPNHQPPVAESAPAHPRPAPSG